MARTVEELEAAAGHVGYELIQLVHMAHRLEAELSLPTDLQNACLESMLLHARSLIDFLIGDRGRKTDLRTSNFIESWSFPSNDDGQELRDSVDVLDKHLAHLTWERVDGGQQAWPHTKVAGAIVHVFSTFVAAVASSDAPGRLMFESAAARARDILQAPPRPPSRVSSTTSSRM